MVTVIWYAEARQTNLSRLLIKSRSRGGSASSARDGGTPVARMVHVRKQGKRQCRLHEGPDKSLTTVFSTQLPEE